MATSSEIVSTNWVLGNVSEEQWAGGEVRGGGLRFLATKWFVDPVGLELGIKGLGEP